ncbi:MAG: 50S ribosomal protein L13 [Magnetococcales bacterium]|nr:50S ribosomal protein L13 [Magnetococcales bacterium]
MKSYIPSPNDITHEWLLVDAENMVLGRLATEIARRLRGKHKAMYTPFLDTGDFVVVVNAEKIRLTGDKLDDKLFHWHSGFIGGIKSKSVKQELQGAYPERVIERAVVGMLPKNKLGRAMAKKLKVYRGAEHPHEAQKPLPVKLS